MISVELPKCGCYVKNLKAELPDVLQRLVFCDLHKGATDLLDVAKAVMDANPESLDFRRSYEAVRELAEVAIAKAGGRVNDTPN